MRKTFLLPILAASLFTGTGLEAAEEGVELVQQIDITGSNPQKLLVTVKNQGDLLRTDMENFSTVMNTSTGDLLTIVHDKQMAMQVPGKATNALLGFAESCRGDEPPMQVTPTGRTEKIGQFLCEEFVGSHKGSEFKVWMSKDTGFSLDFFEKIAGASPGDSPLQRMYAPLSTLDGIPMRVQMTKGDQTVECTTISIRRANFTPADFEAPKNYKVISPIKEIRDLLDSVSE